MQSTARKTKDLSNMRQIINASQQFATQNGDLMPQPGHDIETDTTAGTGLLKYNSSTSPTTKVGQVAALLAIEVGLNDLNIWLSDSDASGLKLNGPKPILEAGAMSLDILNTNPQADTDPGDGFLSFEYVIGLTLASSSQTPLVFSRAELPGGKIWTENDMYNGAGGHIGFVGGNVSWFEGATPFDRLFQPDGSKADSLNSAIGVGGGSIVAIAGNR